MSAAFQDIERDPKLILGRTFAQTFAACLECSDEVQALIRDLVRDLQNPDIDETDCRMALLSITEALFPPVAGQDDHYGSDLEDGDDTTGQGHQILAAMDRQEKAFGHRVEQLLKERGWTQTQLAERIGIGQPAVSLLLSRGARPKTSV